MKFHQGKWVPNNPEKYIGDPNNIIFRSSWEKKFMMWCDKNPSVLKWGSEELIIPYFNPLDNKIHRYFPDFILLFKHVSGEEKRMIIEIKPESQTRMPVKKTRTTTRYLNEVTTYITNEAKWKAATKWCKDRGFEFTILTEKHLHV